MAEDHGKGKVKKADAFKPGKRGGTNQGPKGGPKDASEKRGVKRKAPSNATKHGKPNEKEPSGAAGQKQEIKGPANKVML